MAKVFFSESLNFTNEGEIWSAKNGATRRELKVISKIKAGEQIESIDCQLGFLDKGNHSFIFVNAPRSDDKRILGVFLNSSYSYDLVEGKEIFCNHSSGGYGNSCSTFGIYELGTLLKVYTYKNRQPASYYKLTENGWIYVENYKIEQSEMNEV